MASSAASVRNVTSAAGSPPFFSASASGCTRYSRICGTRMQLIVRIASARISGFGSFASLQNVFTARIARSGIPFE